VPDALDCNSRTGWHSHSEDDNDHNMLTYFPVFIGIIAVVLAFRVHSFPRRSLLCLGSALTIGALSPLLRSSVSESVQVAFSWMALALVVLAIFWTWKDIVPLIRRRT